MYSLLWSLTFVLAVSFISNVSPFVGASYTLLATLQLSLLGYTPFNFATIVLVSAVGASIAKVVIYYGAFGFKGLLLRNRNVQMIGRNATAGKFYLILFVSALVPLFPFDDFIYIGAGASSVPLWAMFPVTLLAKVIKSGFEIAIEFSVLREISSIIPFQRLDVTILLTAIFIVIGILFFRLDWEKLKSKVTQPRVGQVGKPL